MENTHQTPVAESKSALHWNENPLFEAEISFDTDTATDPVARTRKARQNLLASEKGGIFSSNSTKFNAVDKALDEVLKLLPTAITGNFDSDSKSQHNLSAAYGRLLQACFRYNNNTDRKGRTTERQARTDKGRNRQSLVKRIETMAQNDLRELMSYFDKLPGLPAEERATNLQDALRIARTTTVKLKGSWNDQKHFGGAISDLIAVDAGGFEGTGKSGFFKRAEYYETNEAKPLKEKTLEILNRIYDKKQVSKEDYDFTLNEILNDTHTYTTVKGPALQLKQHTRYKTNAVFHDFIEVFIVACTSQDTMAGYMTDDIQINSGEKKVSLTNRNVASARLANLLGRGNLIAQSELATLEDESGNKFEGLLMQKAEGVEAAKYSDRILEQEFTTRADRGEENIKLNSLEKAISGSFQQSLADLQVLDNLFGQVDRHTGNYMVQEKDGMLTGLTGIDNDFAFGDLEIGTSYKTDAVTKEITAENVKHQQYLAYAADMEGNLTIAHMSDDLAQRLTELTETQIKYLMADVLEPAAIKSLWNRIAFMQKAIEKERREHPESKRFLKEGEWNEQTLQDFKNDKNGNNYFQSLLKPQKNTSYKDKYAMKRKLPVIEKVWAQVSRDGAMSTPEKAADFVTSLKFLNAQYWIDSGLLEQWIQEGNGAIPFERIRPFLFSSQFYTDTSALYNFRERYHKYFEQFQDK